MFQFKENQNYFYFKNASIIRYIFLEFYLLIKVGVVGIMLLHALRNALVAFIF